MQVDASPAALGRRAPRLGADGRPRRVRFSAFVLASATLCSASLAALEPAPAANRTAPSFRDDVRPILAGKCFACHGPDEHSRKAELRLDTFEGATADLDARFAMVPGKPEESELLKRVASHDPDERMPPDASKALAPKEVDVLRRWIASGGKYEPHWAFVPPKKAPLPEVKDKAWPRNAIDAFLLAKMEAQGLAPTPEADRYALVRRLHLDLVGLPPSIEEADAFVADSSPDAYEKLVDRLLASPHYGERWGRRWLDLARYADTNGYEKDRPRSIWPYRDWVVKALNADQPFNQFTIEQLAGDLLPGATDEQRIATGFHRNTMLNEEGGIDPLEFRFYAMTDRVATTGATWLGLTLGCTQCHTHKYDPVTHTEYYQLMAFLDNADEPELDLVTPTDLAERERRKKLAAEKLQKLAEQWPLSDVAWDVPKPTFLKSRSGQTPKALDDGSLLFAEGPTPETDEYTLQIDAQAGGIDRVQLEALVDAALPSRGPGRVEHGNFVLSEIELYAEPLPPPAPPKEAGPQPTPAPGFDGYGKPVVDAGKGKPDAELKPQRTRLKLSRAEAEVQQPGFEVAKAIDGDAGTGWAVQVQGKPLNETRSATFFLEKPLDARDGVRLTVVLKQEFPKHSIGRPRLRLGAPAASDLPAEQRRAAALSKAYEAWSEGVRKRLVEWTDLAPSKATSNMPVLEVQADRSVFVSGDTTKDDTYTLEFADLPAGTIALRLEALPDDRLPNHGPGMCYYEGPKGDFFLGEFQVFVGGEKVKIAQAAHSFAAGAGGASAAAAIDGNPETGWACTGRFGEPHQAMFILEKPLPGGATTVKLRFGRHFACSLGRFRIAASSDANAGKDVDVSRETADALRAADDGDPLANEALRRQFLLTAPELAAGAKEIRELRKDPAVLTSLVFRERPASHPRATHRRHRGEYLQPKEQVFPGVPAFLPQPAGAGKLDRLAFAKWVVAKDNPLTARVVVNRQWGTIFGQGIVRTQGDFGLQGEAPSHAELLDWLAVDFVENGWSLKKLHRLMVTSAAYRQGAAVSAKALQVDPRNRLLSHAPRFRVDAELVRDAALHASGLLSKKMYGPPVRPPQPASVTETAYAGGGWQTSSGEDRYRRGVYTFSKRTTPYAMFNTFDGPSGEVCLAQREVSNTPLQSLTLLNDEVYFEAARKLGEIATAFPGDDSAKAAHLFRRCLTRPPRAEETRLLVEFVARQRERLAKGELKAAELAGGGQGDAAERAAWTAVARALLNLDETITRN